MRAYIENLFLYFGWRRLPNSRDEISLSSTRTGRTKVRDMCLILEPNCSPQSRRWQLIEGRHKDLDFKLN